MDAQAARTPRSLRNCYLTEGDEEIAAAVTQRVRRLGITVQRGWWRRLRSERYSNTPKQTYTKTYTPPPDAKKPSNVNRCWASTYDSRDGRI
jgi:hypothetical protein